MGNYIDSKGVEKVYVNIFLEKEYVDWYRKRLDKIPNSRRSIASFFKYILKQIKDKNILDEILKSEGEE